MKFNQHTLIGTMRTIKVRRCPEYTQDRPSIVEAKRVRRMQAIHDNPLGK